MGFLILTIQLFLSPNFNFDLLHNLVECYKIFSQLKEVALNQCNLVHIARPLNEFSYGIKVLYHSFKVALLFGFHHGVE